MDGVIYYATEEIKRQELAREVIINIQDYLTLAQQAIAASIQVKPNN
ncbi:MAG: hypothetical protein NY202_01310 [Mollicutes bacterium UO1]